ncbi:MAG: TRAP transporter large permease subunit [Deltaproteobacteria bacterium]|nr:TRAP transporter large permease subunit [Deltaproteobacteria bacterium]
MRATGSLMASVERWFAIAVLLLMTLLPTLESVIRRTLGRGVPDSIVLTQHLTLWIGFLGALLAAGSGKHLALATGEFLAVGRWRNAAQVYVGALSTGVCILLAQASLTLVKADATATGNAFAYGPPEWWFELIMPVTLVLMALRFAWRASRGWPGRGIALVAGAGTCLLALLGDHGSALVWPGAVALLLGVLLGAPLFVAMAGLAMLLFFGDGVSIAAVPAETYRLVTSPSLPAIPLLTAAGYVLAEGGASQRLARLARATLGWAPGGIALMVVVVCAGFTAFTGGSGVTILAVGGLMLPMLLSEKYPKGFSVGLVTCAGSLGLLFPPSLPVILYAVVAKASVQDLYLAGLLPGIALLLAVGIYAVVIGLRDRARRQAFDGREFGRALWTAKWELLIPAIVVFSIVTGFATIVESAALAVVAAISSQSFVFRDLHWREQLPGTLQRASTLVGAVLILLGVAMGLTSYLVDAQIPDALIEWTRTHIDSQVVFLLLLNAVLLVLGSVLEIFSAIIILAPLLAPMALAYGIDPLHLGIVFLLNLEIGFLLPPMGLNLILSSTRFNQPLVRLYRVSLPFLLIGIAVLLLVTYAPMLTTGALELIRR